MTLSAIIIIIFIISAPKYSNILIDNKIGGLSLSKLYPKSQINLIVKLMHDVNEHF